MILCGKSLGKPTFGCPFCSACTPDFLDGELYTLGDLDELNQVWDHFCIKIDNLYIFLVYLEFGSYTKIGWILNFTIWD